MNMYSRPGQWTTIKLYLPQVRTEEAQPSPTEDVQRSSECTGTILVVEDNEAVREFTCDTLREIGFHVIEAVDGAEALAILDRTTDVDLLFTDIGLPGLNGRELAATVRRRYPKVRTLFTSGYAQMPGPAAGSAVADIPLLSKPFTRAQLWERICQVLERP